MANYYDKQYDETVSFLNMLRRNSSLNEGYEGDYNESGKVTLHKNDFQDVYSQIVDTLTQKIPNINIEDDALILNKNNNTIILEGTIQSLNNLQFSMTTDTTNGEGLYITVEGCNLTDEALNALSILHGYYKIFKRDWSINAVKSKLNQVRK